MFATKAILALKKGQRVQFRWSHREVGLNSAGNLYTKDDWYPVFMGEWVLGDAFELAVPQSPYIEELAPATPSEQLIEAVQAAHEATAHSTLRFGPATPAEKVERWIDYRNDYDDPHTYRPEPNGEWRHACMGTSYHPGYELIKYEYPPEDAGNGPVYSSVAPLLWGDTMYCMLVDEQTDDVTTIYPIAAIMRKLREEEAKDAELPVV